MPVSVKIDSLTRVVSPEEREELRAKAHQAFAAGNRDLALSFLEQVPLRPAMAKFWFKEEGAEFVRENFNLSDANEAFGEGWLDG